MQQKVGIIGVGAVGASVAISTLHSGAADELWLHDLDAARAEGEAMDLAHGAWFYPACKVRTADVQAMRTALPTLGAEAGQAIAKQTAMLETLLRERKGAAQAVVEPSPAGSAAMSSPERLPAVPQLAPAGAMPVPAATLRQVWIRAFWGVTGLWFLVAVLTYALGFWQVGR